MKRQPTLAQGANGAQQERLLVKIVNLGNTAMLCRKVVVQRVRYAPKDITVLVVPIRFHVTKDLIQTKQLRCWKRAALNVILNSFALWAVQHRLVAQSMTGKDQTWSLRGSA